MGDGQERETKRELEDLPPLRPVEFYVLLSLAEGERHGYGIVKHTEERVGTAPDLGTLYRALRRLREAGWIEESDRRPAAEADDERRNYYRITPLGRDVARAEARRLDALARAARVGGLLEEGA